MSDVKLFIDGVQVYPSTVTPPTVFTCPKDGLTFASQALLDAHTLTAHPVVPVGTYGPMLAKAVDCNFVACTNTDKGLFGYIEPGISNCNSRQTPSANGTTWFLVDASKVVPPVGAGKPGAIIKISITGYGIVTQAKLHPIDAANNLYFAQAYKNKGFVAPYDIILDNGQGATKSLYSNQRYLVEVVGSGGAISVYYGP